MQRLPKGTLSPLAEKTGLKPDYLSALITTRKRPSRKRAQFLEISSKEIGKEIPASVWLLGSQHELREAILNERTAATP